MYISIKRHSWFFKSWWCLLYFGHVQTRTAGKCWRQKTPFCLKLSSNAQKSVLSWCISISRILDPIKKKLQHCHWVTACGLIFISFTASFYTNALITEIICTIFNFTLDQCLYLTWFHICKHFIHCAYIDKRKYIGKLKYRIHLMQSSIP